MIELTLGAIVAALVAKGLERVEDRTVDQGEGVLKRLIEVVRDRLSWGGDPGAVTLERLEESPGSKSQIEALARLLDQCAGNRSEFQRELRLLVKELESTGMDIGSAVQVAYGVQSPQFLSVSDSEINVSYDAPTLARPRRISD